MRTQFRAASRAASALFAIVAFSLAAASAGAQNTPPILSEGFEGAFQNDPNCKQGTCKVLAGWGVWFIPRTENDLPGVNFQPQYDQTSSRVQSGSAAQRIWTENATFTGGIYRVVNDVQVGAKVRFTLWGQVWSTNDESPISARPSRDIRVKIGVDPLGGNQGQPSPLNGQVIWSPEQDAKDGFVQFSVEVEAKSPTVILYTYTTMKDNVRHNEVFWDSAVLEYLAPPPTATPAGQIADTAQITSAVEAALTAASTPQSNPAEVAASPEVTYTIKSGDTLFGISLEQDVSLEDLLKNNPGVQAETLQIGQVLVIKPGATTPAPVPAPDAAAAATPDPNVAGAVVATQTITATPTVGQACVQAFFDDNGDGTRDDEEDLVPNITFVVSAGGAQLGSYTTMGVDEPYCFENLQNGAYTVAATVTDIYAPTTPLNDTLNVDGAKSFFSLGLRRVSAGFEDVSKTPTPVPTPSSDGSATLGILSIGGGALLLLGTVGIVTSLVLRRRRL